MVILLPTSESCLPRYRDRIPGFPSLRTGNGRSTPSTQPSGCARRTMPGDRFVTSGQNPCLVKLRLRGAVGREVENPATDLGPDPAPVPRRREPGGLPARPPPGARRPVVLALCATVPAKRGRSSPVKDVRALRSERVAEADRKRVFQPFCRLGDPGDRTGVGLGLAVARSLAETMGGTVEPEDTPGVQVGRMSRPALGPLRSDSGPGRLPGG